MQSKGQVSEETHETVPLAEETVSVRRDEVVTGRVRVKTRTEAEDHIVEAELSEDHVEVTRVPVDRVVDFAPSIRTEGDVTIVPVLEEVAVVETRLVLREELHIRRRTELRTASVPVTLRRQTAEIERDAVDEHSVGPGTEQEKEPTP
jgi:stress response protein YsnF